MGRVSLKLENVLERVENKTLEQKYGYLQATYCDLTDCYAAQAALLAECLEVAKLVYQLLDITDGTSKLWNMNESLIPKLEAATEEE